MPGLADVFNTTISFAQSLLVDNPIPTPPPSNSIVKTQSNVNQLFKFVGKWNDNIDNEVTSLKSGENTWKTAKGYIIKCPALFVEFEPGDGSCILGGITQYMEAKLYLHIFSDELNTDNRSGKTEEMDSNYQIDYLRDRVVSGFNGFHPSFGSALMNRFDALDYKHGTITKYVKGFEFCWNDTKGSVYDPRSPRYQTSQLIPNIMANPIADVWVSGGSYVALSNVVYLNLTPNVVGNYLCTTTNNSTNFTPIQWAFCALWAGGTGYIIGAYVSFGYFIWQCTTSNNDTIFNQANWILICRI